MEKDQVLAELTAERLDLCDYLEQLDDDAWTTTSLCAGWTVHDVVAHLVLNTEQTTLEFIKGLIRRHAATSTACRSSRPRPVRRSPHLRNSCASSASPPTPIVGHRAVHRSTHSWT